MTGHKEGPKNPGERNRDKDKSERKRDRDLFASQRDDYGFADEEELTSFGDDSYSTERFDASTHADKMTRMDSIEWEKAVLVGAYLPGQGKSEFPLRELEGLAEAANVKTVGTLIQRRQMPDVACYIGSGKVAELIEIVHSTDADVVIFDNDLAPGQTRNLERQLKVKVIDRSELILDIFASRAQTHEARLAVELAQLEYSLPRLKRMWTHLERQAGGGVGLRGPGEKQLEVDRRIAQMRISDLKKELDQIHQRREREVRGRKWSRTVCLVGYTNAGKSTLLNRMTASDVYVEDLLFATLDTRTKRWFLPGWGPVLLSDTVGFIRDLPHHLIASFRATLEEATSANLLIHVADASNPEVVDQIASAYQVLDDIGIREKDTVLVLNKTDAITSPETLDLLQARYPLAIPLSAKDGKGIEKLTAAVSEALSREFVEIYVESPIADGRLTAWLTREGEVLSREYSNDKAVVHCRVPRHILGKLQKESDVVVREA